MKTISILTWTSIICLIVLMTSCNSTANKKVTVAIDEHGYAVLTDAEVENLVKRSYQYVTLVIFSTYQNHTTNQT